MFNGQNILPDFPEGLSKVVIFLKEKAAAGEFVFSDSFSEWENNEEVINSIGLGIDSDNFYYAVSLAYLAYLNKIGFVSPARRYEAPDRCTAAANVI